MIITDRAIILATTIALTSLVVKAQTPVTLKQALTTAKEKNPILKTESFNIGIAESDIITAKLRPIRY